MNNQTRTFPAPIAVPRWLLGEPPADSAVHTTAMLIVGGGVAGLMAALLAAQEVPVVLLTRGALMESNSARAQGGIAAALDPEDAPALQVADTLIAGAGLSDRPVVEVLAEAAPDLMYDLARIGVPFERRGAGFDLGLEGGHSRRRILHAGGDATGWMLTNTLAERVRNCDRIQVLEGFQVVDLLGDSGTCTGVLARDSAGGWHRFYAGATILATGGAGALYGLTSNHSGALGEAIGIAFRAGAEVADMEFVQFHPTVFRTRSGEGFLISEAVRGEGAYLRTQSGYRFMPDLDPRAELAPRDVVARGIFTTMQREQVDHVMLDVTHLDSAAVAHHFPTIVAACRSEGIDPSVDQIPVAPAAHYLMGGIRTDLDGATNLRGLFAAGECACTGIHGANRLASNSLLECLVFGRRAARAALDHAATEPTQPEPIQAPQYVPTPPAALWPVEAATAMREQAGLVRSGDSLSRLLARLHVMSTTPVTPDAAGITRANAALTARLIATGAFLREESRGAHQRSDFPATEEHWHGHLVQTLDEQPHLVPLVAEPQSREVWG